MRATIGGMIRTVVKEGAAKPHQRGRPAVKPLMKTGETGKMAECVPKTPSSC